nr:RecName: Full=Malanin chain A [Malania oleifera]
DYPKLTFTTS